VDGNIGWTRIDGIRRIIFHLYLRMTFDFHIDDAIFAGKVKRPGGSGPFKRWFMNVNILEHDSDTRTLRSGNLFAYPPADPTLKLRRGRVMYIVIIRTNVSGRECALSELTESFTNISRRRKSYDDGNSSTARKTVAECTSPSYRLCRRWYVDQNPETRSKLENTLRLIVSKVSSCITIKYVTAD